MNPLSLGDLFVGKKDSLAPATSKAIIEMVKDAIKKNKDGAYSLPPEQYEKKLKKEAEALEKENNEANNSK